MNGMQPEGLKCKHVSVIHLNKINIIVWQKMSSQANLFFIFSFFFHVYILCIFFLLKYSDRKHRFPSPLTTNMACLKEREREKSHLDLHNNIWIM